MARVPGRLAPHPRARRPQEGRGELRCDGGDQLRDLPSSTATTACVNFPHVSMGPREISGLTAVRESRNPRSVGLNHASARFPPRWPTPGLNSHKHGPTIRAADMAYPWSNVDNCGQCEPCSTHLGAIDGVPVCRCANLPENPSVTDPSVVVAPRRRMTRGVTLSRPAPARLLNPIRSVTSAGPLDWPGRCRSNSQREGPGDSEPDVKSNLGGAPAIAPGPLLIVYAPVTAACPRDLPGWWLENRRTWTTVRSRPSTAFPCAIGGQPLQGHFVDQPRQPHPPRCRLELFAPAPTVPAFRRAHPGPSPAPAPRPTRIRQSARSPSAPTSGWPRSRLDHPRRPRWWPASSTAPEPGAPAKPRFQPDHNASTFQTGAV